MLRSLFLAALVIGTGAVSRAFASDRAMGKVGMKSVPASAIHLDGVLRAQTFSIPREFGALDVTESVVVVSEKIRSEQSNPSRVDSMAYKPVLGPYLRNNQTWQQATAINNCHGWIGNVCGIGIKSPLLGQ